MDGCQQGESSDDNVLLNEQHSQPVMSDDTDSQNGDTCQPQHDDTSISRIERDDDGTNAGDEGTSIVTETWPDEGFSTDEEERVTYILRILLIRNTKLVNIVRKCVLLNVYRRPMSRTQTNCT